MPENNYNFSQLEKNIQVILFLYGVLSIYYMNTYYSNENAQIYAFIL